jgi:hypothetical protein
MNSLTREILGLGLKGNKLGAPRYYELSDVENAVHGLLGITLITVFKTYEANRQEEERRRKLEEDARRAREENKGDTWKPAKDEPVRRAEPVEPAKPVEKTPAEPKAQPVPPRVNPSDVHPRTPDQDPDR